MRFVSCTRCARPTGYGVTRVFRKIVFHFCPFCHRGFRKDCDELMART